MPCTTILVGRKASYDGSTMIARNDDGMYDTKKTIVVKANDKPIKYKSKESHLEIELPANGLSYTATPNVKPDNGVWAACGINSANVGMSATETITSNPRVVGADPYVVYKPKKGKEKEQAGGIGEEDYITLVLPYIKSAREGVLRVASLLEKYGTYEPNGIAFNDEKECWWLETIGGHHWIAKKVKDDEYVMMPNQFGLDKFDFEDAYSKKKENLCSKDLKEFIKKNHLDLEDKGFTPRVAFGSKADSDHIYNTPRAWYIGRFFNPTTYKWDGEDADFNPLSDNIPWSLKPEKKITIEDVKYILSSHYQGTPYNIYSGKDNPQKGIYRPIAVSNTDTMSILQIRPYMPKEIRAVQWICYGSNVFNTLLPIYTNTNSLPKYLTDVTSDVDTNNFFWSSRLMGALVDSHYADAIIYIERYQRVTANKGHEIINTYDEKMMKSKDYSLINEANEKVAQTIKEETQKTLNYVLQTALSKMKNRFYRGDN